MASDINEITKKLADALRWYVEEDDVYEGDEPLPEYGGRSWNELNSYWIEGKKKAEAVLDEFDRMTKEN